MLHLCQFGYSITQLLTQERVLLPKLLHSHSQLCQRATAGFTLLRKSLERGGEEGVKKTEEKGGVWRPEIKEREFMSEVKLDLEFILNTVRIHFK